MNSGLRLIVITALTTPLLSCNEGGGLQQRIAELEAQRDAKMAELQRATKEVAELKTKLEQRGGATTPAPAPAPSAGQTAPVVTVEAAPEELPAGYISAVRELERLLKDKVKPLSLTAYPKTIFAGFVSKGADGSHHGVAVPFFSQEDGSTWVIGYSMAELLPELSGQNQVVAPKPQPVAQTTQPKPEQPTPALAETTPPQPAVINKPVNPIRPITPVSPNGDPPRDANGVIILTPSNTTSSGAGTMPATQPSSGAGRANAVKGGNLDPGANVGDDGVVRFPGAK